MEKSEGSIDAKGYVMGAEGMKGFYDKMLVDKANALGKKYGAKVEQKEIGKSKEVAQKEYDEYINKLREKAKTFYLDGNEKLTDEEKITALKMGEKLAKREDLFSLAKVLGESRSLSEMDAMLRNAKSQPIHYLPLTPALKAKALNEGFPLFSAVPNPVSYFPQFDDKRKTKPVNYKPEF